MKPSQVKEVIKKAIEADTVPFITGSPGIGKSSVIEQACQELGYELRDRRASQLDPVDVAGLPHIQEGIVNWSLPEFFNGKEGDKVLIFFDELNGAPKAVQLALYQPILDKRAGAHVLPSTFRFIAAGNRDIDRAVTNRMSTALLNRFAPHIDFTVDIEDWISWAVDKGIMTELISFVRWRPNLLNDFDPKRADKAFPTPRSWEFVNKLMLTNPAQDIMYEMLKGTVGEGATAEFLAFWKICNKLPAPDAVLADPEGAIVPDAEKEPATLYALCGALAHRAKENNMDRLVTYLARIPEEFSVLTIRDALRRDHLLANTRAYIKWNADHPDLV
jgi:MoxR-like ATPase